MFGKKKKNEYEEEVVEEGRDEFSRQTLYLWTKMKMRNQREAALARR